MTELSCNIDPIMSSAINQVHTRIYQWGENESRIELDMQCYSDNQADSEVQQDDIEAFDEEDFELLDEFN